MSKMKKGLSLLLVAAMTAGIAASGTLAYLTSEDSDVNVMTLGNVKIAQHEYQRAEENGEFSTRNIDNQTSYVLEAFEQGKALLPIVGDPSLSDTELGYAGWDETVVRMTQVDSYGYMQVFEGKNAVDKFVTVENTGKSDAYVRTLVAIEVGSGNPALIGTSYHANWKENPIGSITIDGNNYYLTEYVYRGASDVNRHVNGILPAGDTTYPNLSQVYLKSKATNEDMVAIDGNGNGTLDILVLSQAVQAAGFEAKSIATYALDDSEEKSAAEVALDTAFGKASENAAKWFGGAEVPILVDTDAELTAALADGKDVVLTEDITVDSTMTIATGIEVELNLNGNNLSYAVSNSGASAIINNKGTLDIVGEGTISFVAKNPDLDAIPAYATNTITNTGTLTIGEGVTVTNESEGGASYAVDNHGKFTLDGGTLIGDRCALRVAKYNQDNVVFIMNDGLVEAKTPAWIQLPGSDDEVAPKISVTINGGTFQSTKDTSEDNNVLYTYSFGNSHANTSVTINGGEFLGGTVSIGSGYKGDAPTLTINGGTFEYDVLQWLEDDSNKVLYKANK